MESVHCFSCYCFPSKEIDFFLTNCMHIFCGKCRESKMGGVEQIECAECQKTGIKLLKMGPDMPEQVKKMFTPISMDCQQFQREMTRVITFQNKQRSSLLGGLTKKEAVFDKLRTAYNEEKSKKENYKKQLENAHRLLKKQNVEIQELKSISADTQSSKIDQPPPAKPSGSSVKVFSDSMYKTPKTQPKKQLPAFLRSKAATLQAQKHPLIVPISNEEDPFKTPRQPSKSAMGFTTPANSSHVLPHFKRNPLVKQNSG